MPEYVPIDDELYDPFAEVPEVLFHGTSYEGYSSIQDRGIETGHGRGACDFGRAFYTTRDLSQAYKWALRRGRATVVRLRVDSARWEPLRKHCPVGADWMDLVAECVCGRTETVPGYDVVEGQVCKNPRDVRAGSTPQGFGTQTALLNRTAIGAVEIAGTHEGEDYGNLDS